MIILIQNLEKQSIYQMTQLLGSIWLLNSQNFIITFVAWELMSLAIYLFIFSKNENVISNLIKYIILSGYISSFFLFILCFVYYNTGNLAYGNLLIENPLLGLGILIPIIFKLGIVPFHHWAPDLYGSLN